MTWIPVNVELIKNPINWITIILMVVIPAIAVNTYLQAKEE